MTTSKDTTPRTGLRTVARAAALAAAALAVLVPAAAATGLRGLPGASGASLRRPAAPRAARASSSAVCTGLANYEIVRAGSETAGCSEGNRVIGGACSGLGGGAPNADGTAWTCNPGELATAICAAVCSEAPPPTGACCTEGECTDDVTAADCESGGGVYQGDGSTCGPESCEPIGACCVETEELCVEVTETECIDLGGEFVGPVTCDSDEAAVCFEEPIPTGACCLLDEDGRPTCDELTEDECSDMEGEYQGDETDCDEVECG